MDEKQLSNIEKIKEHFKKHKEAYLVAGIAGITMIIMRDRMNANLQSGIARSDLQSGTGQVRPLFLSLFAKNSYNGNKMVGSVVTPGRGAPGFITRCIETEQEWRTQTQAAIAAGTSPANMSAHLNGKFPDIFGLHYERVGVFTPLVP
jgi:hypothetical protein